MSAVRRAAGVAAAVAVLVGCSGDDAPPPSTTTTSAAPSGVAVEALEPGDCLLELPDPASGRAEPVPCRQGHRAEVYAVVALDDGAFPGPGPVREASAAACAAAYEGYAGEPIDPTTDRAFAELVPSASSWADGDRGVICLALPPGGGTERGNGCR